MKWSQKEVNAVYDHAIPIEKPPRPQMQCSPRASKEDRTASMRIELKATKRKNAVNAEPAQIKSREKFVAGHDKADPEK